MRLVAEAFAKFVTKGVSANQGKPRFLKLVGDFTHQQTKHGSKKGCLGAVGTHFKNGQWGCTVVPAMYVVCHQETKIVLSHLVKSTKKALRDVMGLDLEIFVEHWHWDGNIEAEQVFGDQFPAARGHVCLQHARLHTKRRCSGGFKIACPNILDMMAFLPPFPFHIAAELLLGTLEGAGQLAAVKYLKDESKPQSQFSLTIDNWLYIAKWKSSFAEVDALYSAYVSNAKESDWRVHHMAQGGCKRQMLQSLFANCQRQWNTWEPEIRFRDVEHAPCDPYLHPPRLIMGNGLWEKRHSLHSRGFARPTVTSLTCALDAIALECGTSAQFSNSWVVMSIRLTIWTPLVWGRFIVMFATTLDDCRVAFPSVYGVPSLHVEDINLIIVGNKSALRGG